MRKFLIVIDMQNDFITGALGSAEAQVIVPNVVEKVKNFEGEVFFTRDTHHSDYFDTLEGINLPVLHCVQGSEGWQIIDALTPFIQHNYQVINKPTFGYENWKNYLHLDEDEYDFGLGIEFEICGVCTDICVVSNALALRMFYPDALITVDASCCAGVTPEKHKAALEVMKSCQIEVINE